MSSSPNRLSRWLGRLAGRPAPDRPGNPDDAAAAADPTDSGPTPPATTDAAVGPDSDAPPAPSSVPIATGHELIRLIGQGAYGEVWLGRDELGNLHAVKLVRRDHFADKAPFEREYRGLLQYTPISRTHHGLVHILNIGRDNTAGAFFYVMELADCVHGGRNIQPDTYVPNSLEQAIARRGPLPLAECVSIGIELCEGLSYLHSKQLIHRDIKPANIVFVNGLAKLADVGLITHVAEARRDSKHLGTEGFIPPEGPGTALADVYSLGKVLTEAAFGHPAAPDPASFDNPLLARFAAIMAHACHDTAASRSPSPESLQAELMDLNDLLSAQVGP